MSSRTPRDDYHALMWNFYQPLLTSGPERASQAFRRFRELGCNGGTLIATFVDSAAYDASLEAYGLPPVSFERSTMGCSPFLEHDFPFYVMNLSRPLYWSWDQAKPVFQDWYRRFDRERDRRVFTHPTCVNDPAVRAAMERYSDTVMRGLEPARELSLLYDLRDEPSITSFMLASDSCFCAHCMSGMRDWLRGRYADLAELNRRWGSDFTDWEQVEPLTSQEALERRESGKWNFAPWAEHRAFMDESFARAVAQQGELIKRHDPDALVGLAGTQCPSTFGGYDFALLMRELDWIEAYDLSGALDCCRSLKRRRHVPILKTSGLGGSPAARETMLWRYVYAAGGDSGTIIWQSNEMLDVESDELAATEGGTSLAPTLRELRGGIPRLLQLADELSSPVGVHYSQTSIRADFITAVAPRWQSVAASEPSRFPAARCREGWWRLLEDRGLRPVAVDSTQVAAGELIARGIKLFVLPRSIAIGDAEAAELERFVAAGGVLVADGFAGRMDEHCCERARGALDELFGIERVEHGAYHASSQRASFDWDAPAGDPPRWGQGRLRAELELIEEGLRPLPGTRTLGCTEYSDTGLGFLREYGAGRALLCNCAPSHYPGCRTRAAGAALRGIFGGVVELAGLVAEASVLGADGERLPGWGVYPFAHGAARYYGLVPDLQLSQDAVGAIEGDGPDGDEICLRLQLPADGHVFSSRSGGYLGACRSDGPAVEVVQRAHVAPLIAVLPYRPIGVDIQRDGDRLRARLLLADEAEPGEHLFRFDVLDARGVALLDAGANVVAPDATAEWRLPELDSEAHSVTCRDAASGVAAVLPLAAGVTP